MAGNPIRKLTFPSGTIAVLYIDARVTPGVP